MAKKKASRKKAVRRASAKPTAKAGSGRSSAAAEGVQGMSTEALSAELRRRQREYTRLEKRREKLLDQLQEVDREIAVFGGVGVGGLRADGAPRKRPKNEMKLEDALAKVLKGKTMGVTEVAEAVQQAGYKTSSSTFRTIVNQTLIRSKKFKKISRGQYTAR